MISIHAAREGGDDVDYIDKLTHTLFQSTPPVKAATPADADMPLSPDISIHAAREGGDARGLDYIFNLFISIHAAREGGDVMEDLLWTYEQGFQSTPPVKAATRLSISDYADTEISIHAAREGGDGDRYRRAVRRADFNPRRP